ncbi:MAG: hypothetical protein JWL82_159 [Parcubacteria group bacterium]|nr:hypothetical protein [Parcubacteria group bacterium]
MDIHRAGRDQQLRQHYGSVPLHGAFAEALTDRRGDTAGIDPLNLDRSTLERARATAGARVRKLLDSTKDD